MSDKPFCLNCGKPLEDRWLVCKHCHQVRWKLVTPYYIGGIIFIFCGWWSLTQMDGLNLNPNSLIMLFVPILGAVFGLIGIVMLLIAIIATLKGVGKKHK